MSGKNIVIVEDEPDILEVLIYTLKKAGFQITSSLDGEEGLKLIEQTAPNLVLLDLMLPKINGLEICRQLKANTVTQDIPIIMLTAKGEENDIVTGLETGADDYITKPFGPKELVARIHSVLRRHTPSQKGPGSGKDKDNNRILLGDLIIDEDKHEASQKGERIKLTATEFRLLLELAKQPGRVFSRDQLLDKAFGNDAVVADRNIDVHIRAIRKKIGASQSLIETIRSVGYRCKEMK